MPKITGLSSIDPPILDIISTLSIFLRTQNCHCRIRDIACLSCGCVIGYHVSQPCSSCLDGSNNGHLWMFHSEEVSCAERLDPTGERVLKWGEVGDVVDEEERNLHEITVCR